MGAWYDTKTKQEVMNLLILRQLQQSVGTFGLTGLDKLLSFMIVKELQVCTDNNIIYFAICLWVCLATLKEECFTQMYSPNRNVVTNIWITIILYRLASSSCKNPFVFPYEHQASQSRRMEVKICCHILIRCIVGFCIIDKCYSFYYRNSLFSFKVLWKTKSLWTLWQVCLRV